MTGVQSYTVATVNTQTHDKTEYFGTKLFLIQCKPVLPTYPRHTLKMVVKGGKS